MLAYYKLVQVLCSISYCEMQYLPGNMSSRRSTKYVDVLLLEACSRSSSSSSDHTNCTSSIRTCSNSFE
jgi:hypothetical protein